MSKGSKKKARRAVKQRLRDVEDELGLVARWVRADAEAERARVRAELALEREVILGHARSEARSTLAAAQAGASETVALAALDAERTRGAAALDAERTRSRAELEAERARIVWRAPVETIAVDATPSDPLASPAAAPASESDRQEVSELHETLAEARTVLAELRRAVRELCERQAPFVPRVPWGEANVSAFAPYPPNGNGYDPSGSSPESEEDRQGLEAELFGAVEVPDPGETPRKRRRWARAHRPRT